MRSARRVTAHAPSESKQGRRNIPKQEVLDYINLQAGPVRVTAIANALKADEDWLKGRLRRMVQEGLLKPHTVGRNGRLAYTATNITAEGGR